MLRSQTEDMEPADFFTEYGEANRYTIKEVIGKGSYGVVCSATDNYTGETVMLVTLIACCSPDPVLSCSVLFCLPQCVRCSAGVLPGLKNSSTPSAGGYQEDQQRLRPRL